MKSDKILFEEEIDRENKIITIGSKEISYKIEGETGEIPPKPDTGKEELILEYTVEAGEIIELPYDLTYDDVNGQKKSATFNFQVDWGDGTIVTDINNSNIETEEKSKHKYTNEGIYEIKIKGTYEALDNYDSKNYNERLGKEKLTKIKQWGITGLKSIYLESSTNLIEIASPTEKSFVNMQSFDNTFRWCTNLTEIPEDLFANCSNVQKFYSTFAICKNLTQIPENLFANCQNVQNFEMTFYGCESLTEIPENLFVNCQNAQNFEGTFGACTRLTEIPENLFINCTNAQNFTSTFQGCTSLSKIPQNLFNTCTNVIKFRQTFAECEALTGDSISLWKRVENGSTNGYQGEPDGFGCYAGCKKLNNYYKIPEYWRSEPG